METEQESGAGASLHSNELKSKDREERQCNGSTGDGSLDRHSKPALKGSTGRWRCGMLLLANLGLVTLSYVGVEVNMVLFSKSVLRQTNAEAANTFSQWMGTAYLFSLMGTFISDSYLGRYLTCVTFQVVLIIGLVALSFSTHKFLLKPHGCGTIGVLCEPHAPIEVAIFYISIYLIAFGNGAPEPALATFGADQFDEEDPKEKQFLDRAATPTPMDMIVVEDQDQTPNPWHLCTITEVEEVKCILRLLPIWFCTLLPSGVFIQLLSLFVEQGAAMNKTVSKFYIPPAMTRRKPKPLGELQRIGIGLSGVIVAMVGAGIVEQHRQNYSSDSDKEESSLGILWQTPQYILLGTSEALVYVAQMQFFASQTPDALKSLGISLSMSSTAIGSYIYSMILTVVMAITRRHAKPGWVPPNLNHGHLERYFFLSAALIALNLGLFTLCAKQYKFTSFEKPEAEAGEMNATE